MISIIFLIIALIIFIIYAKYVIRKYSDENDELFTSIEEAEEMRKKAKERMKL